MELQYLVENIKCEGCIHSIKTALLKIPFVEAVKVDLDLGTITITGSPEHARVKEALDSLGYPEVGNNTVLKKAKSYISCAIGKMTKK